MALSRAIGTLLLWLCCCSEYIAAFAPPMARSSHFQGAPLVFSKPIQNHRRSSSLNMFLGNDGGFLGVGAPEVFTILLVGYFVLGPSDLYKLVKEIGKGIQNIRTLSADVTKTFENNMESQLQLDELRKAQRELNDAFSFRRSINVDEEAEAFATPQPSQTAVAEAAPTDGGAVSKKKTKRRRIKKKKVVKEEANGNVPDLEMPPLDDTLIREEREAEQRRMERMERLQSGVQPEQSPVASSSESVPEEKNRFAKQLSGDWNEQILANEDKLSPLSKIMERLAILEEEKNAADARLEEEFQLRAELEEKYYREKRELLEEAAAEVQAAAYVTMEGGEEKKMV